MHGAKYVSTFSIVARDPATGDLGVAVASKFLAVGAVVPWARAGVGAVATQALANVTYGPRGLELLATGRTAPEVVEALTVTDPERDQRQVGIVDASGNAASFTGTGCTPWAGGLTGEGFCCQGNILTGPAVTDAMADAFQASRADFPDRLVEAVAAGERAGGDRRGRQSAALLVVRAAGGYGGGNDRFIDLRVDDHPDPIGELRRLLDLHRLYFHHGEPELVSLTPPVVATMQDQLRRLGYLSGEHVGYDEATEQALTRFAHQENLEDRITAGDVIDAVVLTVLQDRAAMLQTGQTEGGV